MSNPELNAGHKHEALHTAYLAGNFIEDNLCSHPYIMDNDELRRLANEAAGALATLYQKIGSMDDDQLQR